MIGWLRDKICGKPKERIVYPNPTKEQKKIHSRQWFGSNSIHTTKYRWWNFIFKNLFEQFYYRHANIYFLIIAILCMIPGLSPIGTYGTLLTLSVVVLVQMVKDFFEDLIKVYSDFQTNLKYTTIIKDGYQIKTYWQNVACGDIVMIKNKESFPADMVFIESSSNNTCFVETSMLDGETDLKLKKAVAYEKGAITCDPPNNEIYKFRGDIDGIIRLNPENILLRGTSLRNTDWIKGIVIYTGHDSKIIQNRNQAPFKKSQLDILTNRYIYLMFTIEIMLCIACVIVLSIYNSKSQDWYIPDYSAFEIFKICFTFFILFSNLVPISLYVSMETAKVLQGYFMSQDLGMYYEASDIPAVVKTSSINEDLGQVQMIFSDKTGTLTANEMKFFKASVSGIPYGQGITEVAKAQALKEGKTIVDPRPFENLPPNLLQFWDPNWTNDKWKEQKNAQDILEYMKFIALCHTVIIEESGRYSSTSPDEFALVDGMRLLGVEFCNRTLNTIEIKIGDEIESYEILELIEFDSDRKRMTIVLKNKKDGEIQILTKGADAIIWPLISSEKYNKETKDNISNFAQQGLRTLLLGKRIISQEKWDQIGSEMKKAKLIKDEKESKQEINRIALDIEKDLTLIGATALEDKLQEGVPKAIAELKKAGIRIWVLTGDKLDTAENIGYACNLLNNEMRKYRLKDDFCTTNEKLEQILKDSIILSQKNDKQGLLIEKGALSLIFANKHLTQLFLTLALKCQAVLCCRVTPSQKAAVVELVNNKCSLVTLAIGDGGNDVSMIQSAKIGIGIAGKEGMQAANSADYSMGQFRYLFRLLIVHGRWSYRRISKLILYSFYKNCVLYLTQFWYFWFSCYSGASVHDTWNISFFNLIFTALPIMFLAIFDRDLDADKAELYPNLYKQGHKRRFFKFSTFFTYILNSIWHSLVCFFIPYFSVTKDISKVEFGLLIYNCVIFVVTTKVILEIGSYSILTILSLAFSLGAWFVYYIVYSNLYKIIAFSEWYSVLDTYKYFYSTNFWAITFLTLTIALTRDVLWKFTRRMVSREAYYQAISAGKNVDKEAIEAGFPLEEGIPIKIKKGKFNIPQLFDSTIGKELEELKDDLPMIPKRLEKIIDFHEEEGYSGFGFSVQDNTSAMLRDYYSSKQSFLVREIKQLEEQQISKIQPNINIVEEELHEVDIKDSLKEEKIEILTQ